MFRFILAVALAAAVSGTAGAESGSETWETWLQGVRAEARERGFKPEMIENALGGLRSIPRVIELDRRQPEFTMTFDRYLARVASEERVRKGRRLLRENAALLSEVTVKYPVQPRFIVALWGVETDFGRLTGGFSVIAALATLAHDGRRSAYFRKELFNALHIIDEGHITAEAMKGSWAGAMGQSQFMPSSFRRYAVDFDGDGRRDIWTSRADVFASAANYLVHVGWKDDRTWGRAVRPIRSVDEKLIGRKVRKRLSEWQALGIRRRDGGDLPGRDLSASLVRPGKESYFLVYDNFLSLLRWNRSDFFATTVGILSDRIAGR